MRNKLVYPKDMKGLRIVVAYMHATEQRAQDFKVKIRQFEAEGHFIV